MIYFCILKKDPIPSILLCKYEVSSWFFPSDAISDDASVVLFCLQSLDAELQKYKIWKSVHKEISKGMQVTITLNGINYESLAKKFLPSYFDSVEKKVKKSFKEKILLFFKRPVNAVAPAIVGKIDDTKLEDMVIQYANDNKEKIISAIQTMANKNDIAVNVEEIDFTKND